MQRAQKTKWTEFNSASGDMGFISEKGKVRKIESESSAWRNDNKDMIIEYTLLVIDF